MFSRCAPPPEVPSSLVSVASTRAGSSDTSTTASSTSDVAHTPTFAPTPPSVYTEAKACGGVAIFLGFAVAHVFWMTDGLYD